MIHSSMSMNCEKQQNIFFVEYSDISHQILELSYNFDIFMFQVESDISRYLNKTCCCGYCPGDIYLFKVKNRNTGKRCEICSKLTIKTPERRFIVNLEHISHLFLVFLLLTLNK